MDYARAVQWLEKDEEPEYAKYDLLGICYLLGHGCQQNPTRGKALLERSKNSPYKSYGMGMMYAEGIGERSFFSFRLDKFEFRSSIAGQNIILK